MRRGRLFLFILFVITAIGCAQTGETSNDPIPPERFSNIDARLHQLLRTYETDPQKMEKSSSLRLSPKGEPVVDLLIQLAPDTLLPQGVTTRTRIGHVVTATATLAGLKALAGQEGVVYVEPSIRLKRRNDIGTSNASGLSGTISAASPTVIYPYEAKASQSLTISMHATPKSTLDPLLKICRNNPCEPTPLASDDNSGHGNDAELTYTFSSQGRFFIVVSDATGTGTGGYILVFHDDADYGDFLLGIGAKPLHAEKDGEGVIVGVIDSGIDWCHEDFIDDTTGKSRILSLWDQGLTAQGGESKADVGGDGKPDNDYGVEYTQDKINAALGDCGISINSRQVRSADTEGHGTHVAGTAAGDGSATNGSEQAGKYKGVAPKADLIIVKNDGDDSRIIDGIDYIFKKADALGKPAVINMSLGGHDGPMDGTSLLDQAIQSATGSGRIIVVAAGNEGMDPIHAEGTIAAGKSHTVKMDFPEINLWHSGGDAYTATLTAPSGQKLSAKSGEEQSGTLDEVSVTIFNATSKPPNGDKNILVTVTKILGGFPGGDWSLTLVRTANGGDGKWDAWEEGVTFSTDVPRIDPNDDKSPVKGTVGEPASSFGAITVGAHSTKFRWESGGILGGVQESQEVFDDFGNIASFSSRGPTRDGRIKPDITAPGNRVMSTLSADCLKTECAAVDIAIDGKHMIIEGTSMASPMVAGAVALILQADPTNFPRPLLKSTATQDSLTGASLPNSTWGAGKVNLVSAFSALQADNPPTVSLSASPASGNATLAATLTATASDPDAGDGIAEYLWDFDGDGATDAITSTSTVSHKYKTAGSYTAKVTVVDQRGKTASATATITVVTTTTTTTTTTSTTITTTTPTTTQTTTTATTTTTSTPTATGGSGGGGCFIATAAYGSYLDPHVQTLRVFRDDVLLQSSWGRDFVDFYYLWSPPVARFIAARPVLKGMTRFALTPIVFTLEQPQFAEGILLILIGGTILRRRTKVLCQ